MSNATNTETATPNELLALTKAVRSLPAEYQNLLDPIVTNVAKSQKRRHRLNTLIQEALTQLRLDIKYLEFDLHATRRERDEFKAELGRYEDLE